MTWGRLPVIYIAWNNSSKFPIAGSAHGTTAVDRGADLLVRVLESDQPVALTDLASAAGLPKSTASRLISALERRGLIEQDGERGRLRPGPGDSARGRAQHARAQHHRARRGRRSMLWPRPPARRSTWPCPGPDGVEHIAQVDSRHFLGAGQWLGRSVGYEHSANGKVFAAFGRAPAERGSARRADRRELAGDPARRTRHLDRRARARAVRHGGAGARRPRRGDRGAQHLGPDAAHDAGAHRASLQPILISEARTLSRRLGHSEKGERAA